MRYAVGMFVLWFATVAIAIAVWSAQSASHQRQTRQLTAELETYKAALNHLASQPPRIIERPVYLSADDAELARLKEAHEAAHAQWERRDEYWQARVRDLEKRPAKQPAKTTPPPVSYQWSSGRWRRWR